jgi:hypothetical protein
MNNLLVLVWLRWRLMINEMWPELFSLSHALHILFILLSFMLFFGFGVSCSFFISLCIKVENKEQWFYYANTIIRNLLLFIIIIKILSSGEIIKRVNSKILRYYPVKTTIRYVFELILRLFDKWYLLAACFLFGFILGFGLSVTSPSFLLILSIIVFAIILGLHLIIEIVEEASQIFLSFSRRIKYSLIVVAIFWVTLYIYTLSASDNPLAIIQEHTPIGFFNKALHKLLIGYKPLGVIQEVWNSLIFISALSLILIIIYIFRKTFITEDFYIKKTPKKKHQLTFERILFFFPKKILPFIIKDLRYFTRSRTTQVLIILELIAFSYISYQVNVNSKNYSEQFIIFLLIYCTTNMWQPYLGNFLGMERDGFRFYLFGPISIADLILSKYLSFLILQIPFIIWTFFIAGYYLKPFILPLIIMGQISAFCLIMIYGNLSSIKSPYFVERYGLIFFPNASHNYSINGFLTTIAFTIYPIFFITITTEFKVSTISYIVIIAITILTFGFFNRAKSKVNSIFIAQQEAIYTKLRLS